MSSGGADRARSERPEGVPAGYLDSSGRPDLLAGGVRMIPVETPAGTFMVPCAFYRGTLGPSIGGSIFDLGELHSDMKVCGILGLRAMVNTLVVRADVGLFDEGAAVQMTIDQPF